ncbi:MAG: hypothetical protein LBQ89_06730 [Treponema sp.]|jgi:hypothetical protein|nr:hypothetical protein [Treponema sp.]
MKNFAKFLGIVAMAAVIGFSMTACDDGGDGSYPRWRSELADTTWEGYGINSLTFISWQGFAQWDTFSGGNFSSIGLESKDDRPIGQESSFTLGGFANFMGIEQDRYTIKYKLINATELEITDNGGMENFLTGTYTKQP